MKMNPTHRYRNGAIAIAFIAVILCSNLPLSLAVPDKDTKVAAIVEATPGEQVLILTDLGSDQVEAISFSIFKALNPVYPLVRIQQISRIGEIADYLNMRFLVTVLVFQTNYTGLFIDGNEVTFAQLASVLASYPRRMILYASGNGKSFHDAIVEELATHPSSRFTLDGDGFPATIHADSEHEELDTEMLFLTAMWELADVFENELGSSFNLIGKKIRYHAVRYFEANVNGLLEGAIQPRTSMGVEDPAETKARYDKAIAKAPRNASAASYKDNSNHTLLGLEPGKQLFTIGQSTGSLGSPVFQDTTEKDGSSLGTSGYGDLGLSPGKFLVALIPKLGGMSGPMATIVDTLLGELIAFAGDSIGLDGDVINQIGSLIGTIKDLLSLASGDFNSAAGMFKSLLQTLKFDFPFPGNLDKYFDVIVDAIFTLQSKNAGKIQDLIKSILNLIIPANVSAIVTKTLKFLGLDSLPSITSLFTDTNKYISAILSHAQEFLINNVTGRLLDTFGSFTTATKNKISALLSTVINYVIEFDPQKLITRLIDNVINTAFSMSTHLSLYSEDFEQAMGILLKAILGYMGYIDNYKLIDVASDYLQLFISSSAINLTGFVQQAQAIKAMASDAIDYVQDAVKNAETSVSTFVNNIKNKILKYVKSTFQPQYEAVAEWIAKIMALLSWLQNPSFNPAQIPSLNDIIDYMLQNVLGMNPTTIANVQDTVKKVTNTVIAFIGFIKGDNSIIDIIKMTPGIQTYLDNPSKLVEYILNDVLNIQSALGSNYNAFRDAISTIMSLVRSFKDNSIQGIMQGLLESLGFVVADHFHLNLGAYLEFLKKVFPKQLDMSDISSSDIESIITTLITQFGATSVQGYVRPVFEIIFNIRGLFDNGISWIINMVVSWISGQLQPLADGITSTLERALGEDILSQDFTFPIGLGSFLSFFDPAMLFSTSSSPISVHAPNLLSDSGELELCSEHSMNFPCNLFFGL
nr:hypothetical protein [Candidatus Sigynarchaeota archaeon]